MWSASRRFATLSLAGACLVLPLSARGQGGPPTPGETSGPTLAQLRVTGFDRETGALTIVYQSGCETTNNNVYYGPLDQVSSLAWSGQVCDIGTSGTLRGFDPGAGSYFFVIVGNRGPDEGSYGNGKVGATTPPRPPSVPNACGQAQNLSSPCAPLPTGATCDSNLDCDVRQECVASAAGPNECRCLPPFDGSFCATCASGFAGPDCRECETGFYSNRMESATGDYVPQDLTAPDRFLCRPDVTESCDGETCSGNGTCTVIERDAVCACDPGYTGESCAQCAPDYELIPGAGCVLAGLCRNQHCGGHGDCVATTFGGVTCDCDSGYRGVDCGGPDFAIATDAERFSLYDGESAVLEPAGGAPPYTWQVLSGPATVTPCVVGGSCSPPNATLVIDAPAGGLSELTLVRVAAFDAASNMAIDDWIALPPACLPFTGDIEPELMPFYRAMCRYMKARGIRAGSLAISKGGKLVGANGYGYLDAGLDADPYVNAGEGPAPLVQPSSPFRLASVSKTFTAAAVRQAAEDAGVILGSTFPSSRAARWIADATGFDLVADTPPFDYNLSAPPLTDQRWANVSITRLLNHHAGHFRDDDLVPTPTTAQPAWNAGLLPFTEDLNDPQQLQTARWGAGSGDMVVSAMYQIAALQLALDPRPTPENLVRFVAGTSMHYDPGSGAYVNGSNYSNMGYVLLGLVLLGLEGETYDPDEPGVPSGWGAFPNLLNDYLCTASGIHDGVFAGDEFNPQPLEPYYRDLEVDGTEYRAWNLAGGSDRIRFNPGIQQWQFCQSGCPDQGAVWNDQLNTPRAYGGVSLAGAHSAGGLVATAPALVKFARNHRIKVGVPNDGTDGIGSKLPAPGAHATSSSHGGANDGVRTLLWQMAGTRLNRVPFSTGAWNDDPSAPVDFDDEGNVIIDEAFVASECDLPSDVVVAALFNQRRDQRAPLDGERSSDSNSKNNPVYERIEDFLASAACETDLGGWPGVSEGGPAFDAPCP